MGLLGIALAAVGFAHTGIRAGSIAATLMRIATVAHGGAMSTSTILGATVAALQRFTMAAP